MKVNPAVFIDQVADAISRALYDQVAEGIVYSTDGKSWSAELIKERHQEETVAPRVVANRWRTLRLARHAAVLLRRRGVELTIPRSGIRVHVEDAMGKGYGHPTPEGEKARELAAAYGVRLDPTYGAKAFSLMLSPTYHAPRTIFWHTFAWP